MPNRGDGMHYRWFAKDEEDEYGMPKSRAERALWVETKSNPRLYRRSERVGVVLSFAVLLYAISARDIPAIFFVLSFQCMEFRKIAKFYGGRFGNSLSNGLKGFAIGLFFGAFLLLFW